MANTAPISGKWLRCSKASSRFGTLLVMKWPAKNRSTPSANNERCLRARQAMASNEMHARTEGSVVQDRKSDESGKRGSVRVDLGGRCIMKEKEREKETLAI